MNTIGTSLIFFYLATFASSTEFKTIDLCPEKTPQNIRKQWKPNHHKMRDLMTEAAIFSERHTVADYRPSTVILKEVLPLKVNTFEL